MTDAIRPARRRAAILVAAIALGGLALRLWGAAFGLPAVYNPDEVAILTRAMALGTNHLDPGNFLYPSLYFYVLFAWEGLVFIGGWIAGVWPALADFERQFFVDPSPLYLAGRALSALLGAATIIALYRLGSRLFDRTTGIVAAAFLAVSPIAVRDAHYVKHDVPVTLLIVLTCVVLARMWTDAQAGDGRDRRGGASRVRGALLAGVLAGLAMSTHYYALFVMVPVALTAWVAAPAPTMAARVRLLVTMGLAATVTFFAASPFLLVEPATAVRDVLANREIVVDRAVAPAGLFGSLGAYLRLLVLDGLTWPLAAAAAAGLAVAIATRARAALFVVAFPVAFLLFIANTVPASRYLNPVLPFGALLAAVAVGAAAGRLPDGTGWTRRTGWTGWTGWATAGATVALGAVALLAGVRSDRFFQQADTRTLAEAWIERSIPAGATVLIQPYSVPLRPTRESLVEALRAHLGSETRASVKFQRQLALDPYPAPAYRTIYLGRGGLDPDKIYVDPAALGGEAGLAPLRALAVEYVVLKRYNDDRTFEPLRDALSRNGQVLMTFVPTRDADDAAGVEPFLHNTDARIDPRLERPGPTIEIWRLHP
ncbi:MAG: glycosyltransferase family 39 protein [Vicinamibacterales bacterium]